MARLLSKDNSEFTDRPRGVAGASFGSSISFENVSRHFEQVTALSDVSLEVNPGETMCLLGESGCGKTTLLRIAAGIETLSSGCVKINDHEVCGENHFVPPERRRVGLVFQDYALFPHLTILENIMFGLAALSEREKDVEARRALHRVQLSEYADSYPHTLSGGQQQRVALARAVAPVSYTHLTLPTKA